MQDFSQLNFDECVNAITKLQEHKGNGLMIGHLLCRIEETYDKSTSLNKLCAQKFNLKPGTVLNYMRSAKAAKILTQSFGDNVSIVVDVLKEIPISMEDDVKIQFWQYVLDQNGGTPKNLTNPKMLAYKSAFLKTQDKSYQSIIKRTLDMASNTPAKKQKAVNPEREVETPSPIDITQYQDGDVTDDDDIEYAQLISCLETAHTLITQKSTPEMKTLVSTWCKDIQSYLTH